MASVDARSGALRRRQALALIVVTLAIGTGLGWLLFGRADDPPPPAATPVVTTPTARAARAKVPLSSTAYPKLGLTLGLPAGWKAAQQSGVVKLSSPDATVSMAVSNSGPGGQEKAVRQSDQSQLRSLFTPARVIGRERGKIGTLPVLSTEIAGQTKKHRPIRILSTAASTRYRTYSVQVFSTPQPPSKRLTEVGAILDSVRFVKPAA